MNFTNKTIAIILTTMTLITAYAASSTEGDLSAIFYLISIGFCACALEAWLQHRREKRLGELK